MPEETPDVVSVFTSLDEVISNMSVRGGALNTAILVNALEVQALLIIATELELLNNNLEMLRPPSERRKDAS